MPKVIRSEEFDQIAEVVGRFAHGADLDEILVAIGGELSRRTLQRRLADLIAEGRVIGGREQKSFKYRLAPITGTLEVTEVLKRDMTALFGVRRVLDLEHTFLYLCMHDGDLLNISDLSSNLEVKRPTAQHFIECRGGRDWPVRRCVR